MAKPGDPVIIKHPEPMYNVPVMLEYKGQIVTGSILRKRGLWYRMAILVKGGKYTMAWVPRWKIIA